MNEFKPFASLDEVRLNDMTVHSMMRAGQPLTAIIVQLANDKALLLREVAELQMRRPPPMLILHPDGQLTPKPPIHIPQIPPCTPQ